MGRLNRKGVPSVPMRTCFGARWAACGAQPILVPCQESRRPALAEPARLSRLQTLRALSSGPLLARTRPLPVGGCARDFRELPPPGKPSACTAAERREKLSEYSAGLFPSPRPAYHYFDLRYSAVRLATVSPARGICADFFRCPMAGGIRVYTLCCPARGSEVRAETELRVWNTNV